MPKVIVIVIIIISSSSSSSPPSLFNVTDYVFQYNYLLHKEIKSNSSITVYIDKNMDITDSSLKARVESTEEWMFSRQR